MEQPGPEQPKEGAPMEIGDGSRQSKKTKTIPIEFLDADKGCLKRELKILELKIAEMDEKAPGTPRHLRLLQLYLDKLDEDIEQTTKAGFAMSIKAIQTLQENYDILKEHVKVLERSNLVFKLRIKELQAVNQSLHLRLAREEKAPHAMAPR